jgi:hypothetical protein
MNGKPITAEKKKKIIAMLKRGVAYRDISEKLSVGGASISEIANQGKGLRPKAGAALRRSQQAGLDSDLRWRACTVNHLRVISNAGHVVIFYAPESRTAFLRAHRVERKARKKTDEGGRLY